MTEQVIRLIYPPTKSKTPLINQLIRKHQDLTVNILRTKVNTIESWLEIQIVGRAAVIENAINWIREQGIEVQTLSA
ncbi:MAG: FeS-binding protein [Chloroflexi bacterium]|nr:FeS-binding protein [Chloroflexota bacterium]